MNDGVLLILGGGLTAVFFFLYIKYWKIADEGIQDFFSRDSEHWKSDIKEMSPGIRIVGLLLLIFWAIGWVVVGILALFGIYAILSFMFGNNDQRR